MIRNSQTICRYLFANFNSSKDYYKILNVKKSSSQSQIKKAYLKLAKVCHPDTNKGKQQQFKEVNQAYQILSNQVDKKDYDQARSGGSTAGPYTNSSQGYQQQYNHQNYTYRDNQRSKYGPNPNTYRGYQGDANWDNPQYRQKVMQQMFRMKYAQGYRQGGRMGQKQFDEMLKQRSRQTKGYGQMYEDFEQKMRKRAQQISRQQINRANRMQEERRQQQFKQYKDKAQKDLENQMKNRAQQMVQGLKNNIQGAVKVGKYVKSLWQDLTKKK